MEADQRRAFWAQIALGLGSVIQILGMPIIVGALQDHWNFTAADAGYITSIDLAGLCIGAITTSAWAPKLNWQRYMGITIVLGAGMNVLCLWFHTFGALAVLRFGAGLASGAEGVLRAHDPAHLCMTPHGLGTPRLAMRLTIAGLASGIEGALRIRTAPPRDGAGCVLRAL